MSDYNEIYNIIFTKKVFIHIIIYNIINCNNIIFYIVGLYEIAYQFDVCKVWTLRLYKISLKL